MKRTRCWLLLTGLLLAIAFAGPGKPGGAGMVPAARARAEETAGEAPKAKKTAKPTKTPKVTPEPTPKPDEDFEIEGDVLVACKSTKKKVTVPEGIREIGKEAFQGLTKLETVKLPDSVEEIGVRAFAGCKRLQKVSLSAKSKLERIRKQAFLNCVRLNTSFVPEGARVAEDAFEGVKPTAAPTEEVTPEPEEEEPDVPIYNGGGGGGGGKRTQHARSTATEGPDYDLISLKALAEGGETGAMEQLTLGGEALELSLTREKDAPGAFTVSAMNWRQEAEEAGQTPADTMVLTEVSPEAEADSTWVINGAVLRRMNRSGIDHLVLRRGDRIVSLETDGILAGWAYDLLKSRGTGSRLFEYRITLAEGEAEPLWQLQVEEETWVLTENPQADIFLEGVFSGSAAVLEAPFEQLREF